MGARFIAGVVIAALVCAAGLSRSALEQVAGSDDDGQELLYLPNGKHLRILSLGHATLLADMVYLWAIQYYSNYEREHRHRYVEHVFSEVITELDPHYIDAYWLGALILIIEGGQVDAGLRLLDKGIERNPDEWVLPYLAGWECYHAGRYDRARAYFERASRVEDAPTVVRRLRAGLLARAGAVERALAMWRDILEDPKSDSLSRKIAQRKIRELQTRIDVDRLQGLVDRFRDDNGRWPRRLDELIERSYTRALPLDPEGHAYAYDAETGQVSSVAGRVLGGS